MVAYLHRERHGGDISCSKVTPNTHVMRFVFRGDAPLSPPIHLRSPSSYRSHYQTLIPSSLLLTISTQVQPQRAVHKILRRHIGGMHNNFDSVVQSTIGQNAVFTYCTTLFYFFLALSPNTKQYACHHVYPTDGQTFAEQKQVALRISHRANTHGAVSIYTRTRFSYDAQFGSTGRMHALAGNHLSRSFVSALCVQASQCRLTREDHVEGGLKPDQRVQKLRPSPARKQAKLHL